MGRRVSRNSKEGRKEGERTWGWASGWGIKAERTEE